MGSPTCDKDVIYDPYNIYSDRQTQNPIQANAATSILAMFDCQPVVLFFSCPNSDTVPFNWIIRSLDIITKTPIIGYYDFQN